MNTTVTLFIIEFNNNTGLRFRIITNIISINIIFSLTAAAHNVVKLFIGNLTACMELIKIFLCLLFSDIIAVFLCKCQGFLGGLTFFFF